MARLVSSRRDQHGPIWACPRMHLSSALSMPVTRSHRSCLTCGCGYCEPSTTLCYGYWDQIPLLNTICAARQNTEASRPEDLFSLQEFLMRNIWRDISFLSSSWTHFHSMRARRPVMRFLSASH